MRVKVEMKVRRVMSMRGREHEREHRLRCETERGYQSENQTGSNVRMRVKVRVRAGLRVRVGIRMRVGAKCECKWKRK